MKTEIINGQKIKIYDNNGKTFDRYTIIYMGIPVLGQNNLYECFGCSENPFHPQGFGMHSQATPGKHLGKRICFNQLPINVQKYLTQKP